MEYLGKLNDYDPPVRSVIAPSYGSDGVMPKGPVNSPIKNPNCAPGPVDPAQALSQIARDIGCIKDQYERDRYLMSTLMDLIASNNPPRDSIPILVGAAATALTPSGQSGTWTTLVTVTLEEGYEGMITGAGLGVFPDGAWPDVTFRLQMNNASTPNFDNQTFLVNSLQSFVPVHIRLKQGSTVTLQALNSGSMSLYASGSLHGWKTAIKRL